MLSEARARLANTRCAAAPCRAAQPLAPGWTALSRLAPLWGACRRRWARDAALSCLAAVSAAQPGRYVRAPRASKPPGCAAEEAAPIDRAPSGAAGRDTEPRCVPMRGRGADPTLTLPYPARAQRQEGQAQGARAAAGGGAPAGLAAEEARAARGGHRDEGARAAPPRHRLQQGGARPRPLSCPPRHAFCQCPCRSVQLFLATAKHVSLRRACRRMHQGRAPCYAHL